MSEVLTVRLVQWEHGHRGIPWVLEELNEFYHNLSMRESLSLSVLLIPSFLLSGGLNSTCSLGYTGKLCSICAGNLNGTIYARTNPGECRQCLALEYQVLEFLGILLLLACYLVYIL